MEFPNLKREVRESMQLANETGQRIRKRFNRAEFIKQFPKLGSDPRAGFLPENFVLDIEPMIEISCGELRELCLANKGSPLALQKAFSIEGFHDDQMINILKEDYNILSQKTPKVPAGKILVPKAVAEEIAAERASEPAPEPEAE